MYINKNQTSSSGFCDQVNWGLRRRDLFSFKPLFLLLFMSEPLGFLRKQTKSRMLPRHASWTCHEVWQPELWDVCERETWQGVVCVCVCMPSSLHLLFLSLHPHDMNMHAIEIRVIPGNRCHGEEHSLTHQRSHSWNERWDKNVNKQNDTLDKTCQCLSLEL